MNRVRALIRPSLRAVGAAGLLALAGATAPSLLSAVEPGLWEIERSGAPPQRQCVARIAALSQIEHRGAACTRVVVKESAGSATVHYTCPGGGFGESTLDLITPRSLRIETQGIAQSLPFHYKVQARRVGDCPGR